MKNTVITPSYNMINYLKRCYASVLDQNVNKEHIIIDNNSTDGTKKWASDKENICFISQKDEGMYDAINTGLKLAKGDIISYINCDEQYLEHALPFVQSYLQKNKNVDMLFGDVLIVDPQGMLLSFRKSYQPKYHYILASHLYNLSCAMFFRRKLIDDGLFFDKSFKNTGDEAYVIQVLKSKYKVTYVRKYLSVFTYTGENLSLDAQASEEKKMIVSAANRYFSVFKPFINLLRLSSKFLAGSYFQKMPIEYSIYTENSVKRKNIYSNNVTFRWPTL